MIDHKCISQWTCMLCVCTGGGGWGGGDYHQRVVRGNLIYDQHEENANTAHSHTQTHFTKRFKSIFHSHVYQIPRKWYLANHAYYKNTSKRVMCRCNFHFFSCRWTIILRFYQCSSLGLSNWAGKHRCLSLGDRCHVLNTAPDRLAVGHHSSLLPNLQSTRTPRARTRHGHCTESLHSPLQSDREKAREWRDESEVGWVGRACLIIIISSPSMKAVFFVSHPEVNHPSYNPCICFTTLHFIGHLEVKLR